MATIVETPKKSLNKIVWAIPALLILVLFIVRFTTDQPAKRPYSFNDPQQRQICYTLTEGETCTDGQLAYQQGYEYECNNWSSWGGDTNYIKVCTETQKKLVDTNIFFHFFLLVFVYAIIHLVLLITQLLKRNKIIDSKTKETIRVKIKNQVKIFALSLELLGLSALVVLNLSSMAFPITSGGALVGVLFALFFFFVALNTVTVVLSLIYYFVARWIYGRKLKK